MYGRLVDAMLSTALIVLCRDTFFAKVIVCTGCKEMFTLTVLVEVGRTNMMTVHVHVRFATRYVVSSSLLKLLHAKGLRGIHIIC